MLARTFTMLAALCALGWATVLATGVIGFRRTSELRQWWTVGDSCLTFVSDRGALELGLSTGWPDGSWLRAAGIRATGGPPAVESWNAVVVQGASWSTTVTNGQVTALIKARIVQTNVPYALVFLSVPPGLWCANRLRRDRSDRVRGFEVPCGAPSVAATTCRMPQLTVEGVGTFEVPQGKRLVNALLDEAKIDQLHACGGQARCTTCRVQFVGGEPAAITKAEKELIELRGLGQHPGVRLSCQIACEQDMALKAISRLAGSGRSTPGNRPTDEIQPPPEWVK
jgi:ferredoxin